jgi:hypothetical protein
MSGKTKTARKLSSADELLLERVQRASFEWFLEYRDRKTGMIQDRSKSGPATIAGVGFGLTCAAIGVERQWIGRAEGVEYTLSVLRTLSQTPSGDTKEGCGKYHGYFYHFLEPSTAVRSTAFWAELSSIDTALLMAGVLFAREYYRKRNTDETEIRRLASELYEAVEWTWLLKEDLTMCMGWSPEQGMIPAAYKGFCEAPILYLMALGSPTHAIPPGSWAAQMDPYKFESQLGGKPFITCEGAPMFFYQYPHCWVDFRGIRDEFNRKHGLDYFENSKRATIAQHRHAVRNEHGFRGYGRRNWGLTACDGAADVTKVAFGKERQFRSYAARGPGGFDDGTIAPTAAISSMPFAPKLVMPTIKAWLKERPELFNRFGFADAFNPTFDETQPSGWIDSDRLSIDQGPIIIMIENFRTGFVWNVMRRSPYLRRALKRAGFTGGWLKPRKRS